MAEANLTPWVRSADLLACTAREDFYSHTHLFCHLRDYSLPSVNSQGCGRASCGEWRLHLLKWGLADNRRSKTSFYTSRFNYFVWAHGNWPRVDYRLVFAKKPAPILKQFNWTVLWGIFLCVENDYLYHNWRWINLCIIKCIQTLHIKENTQTKKDNLLSFKKINDFLWLNRKTYFSIFFHQLKMYFDVYIYVINLILFFDLKFWLFELRRLRAGLNIEICVSFD